MQTSSINPPAKLQRRHTGTKPGEEIKVRVEGYARVTKGDRPGVPSGPARQASKGHATNHISSHSAFSLPGPGYALPPKPCRRPPYGPKVEKRCGPNVLLSFSNDLCLQLLRANSQTIWKHRERFKYGLSYKWLKFESQGEDGSLCPMNCPNTVTLCGYCVPKNQLGNIALMRVLYNKDPYGVHDSKINYAWSLAETYPSEHPHRSQFGEWAGKPRADNAAAFGLGNHIASNLLTKKWNGSVEGCSDLVVNSLCDIDHRANPDQASSIMQGGTYFSKFYKSMLERQGIPPEQRADLVSTLDISDLGTMLIDGRKVNVVKECRPCISTGDSILDRHSADKLGRV